VLDPRKRSLCSFSSRRASPVAGPGEFAALVTAPVHKSVINDGGIPFVGHTE